MWHPLESIEFTWPKYIGKVGFAVNQVCNDAYSTPLKLNSDVSRVGFCDAKDLKIRQRSDGYAVMVEMDGEDFWFHVNELPI